MRKEAAPAADGRAGAAPVVRLPLAIVTMVAVVMVSVMMAVAAMMMVVLPLPAVPPPVTMMVTMVVMSAVLTPVHVLDLANSIGSGRLHFADRRRGLGHRGSAGKC
jgi:hypothetical protein